jgi:signal transduction histidine kinase
VPLSDLSSDLPVLDDRGVRNGILAPLRANGAAQGVLIVGSRGSREIEAADIDLLTIVAGQLGLAIDGAYLHREAARKLDVQAQLNELAERIVSEVDLDTIIETLLSRAPELTGADGAAIALGDRRGDHGVCTVGFPPYPATGPIRVERAVDGEVMRTRRPVVIEDYPSYPEAVPTLVEAGLADIAAVPIVCGEHIFGALTLFHLAACRDFADSDIAVAVELGRQAGIAIENAQLYESTRFYVRQVTRAQEDERKRIAREIHDETIQSLVVVSRRLESLSLLADQLPAAAQERIGALQDLLAETMRGMRRFVQDLRPPMLDHLGLVASVEALAGDLQEHHGIEAMVRVAGEPRRLGLEEELVLYRIVQEAIGNTRRHSAASRVEVHMEFDADAVRISVSDDGCGFAVPKRIDAYVSEEKLGLIGMKERARTLGGELTIRSKPGLGTRITAEIPTQPSSGPDGSGTTG